MEGVDINTLTMEQYLALSREKEEPDVVKLEIGGNVNFEIQSQFMRELREDTFSENKNKDAHDHIDRVLNIELSTLGDLLKKAFIQRTTNGAPSSSTEKCKVVNADHETSHRHISSSKHNNIHGVSDFQVAQNEEERMTDVLQCQLPPKELNPGNFTLPCTIGNFNFYGMADLGASVNVMPKNIFEYLRLASLRNTNILVEMADMTKKAPLADSKDRPPMLTIGRYAQWRLRHSLVVPEHTTVETILNMSPENKAHFKLEKEAIHLILTGIGDEIYSTVDACKTAHEMWKAIERSHATTRHKGKEIAKPITPPSESAFEEDSDPKQAQRDKDMQKNLALIAKYFKRSTNQPTTDSELPQTPETRTWILLQDTNGQVVHQTEIQCFNCKEFGHFAKECRKPKRVKDSAYHKEKMLLCKQAKQGVPLQAEQSDWLADTDEEIDEQELEAHYSYMAKIQEVPTVDLETDSRPLEQVQNDTGYNVFANEVQYSKQPESISNTCVVEAGDSNVIPDSPIFTLQNKQTQFERYKAFNDRTVNYDKLKRKLNETLGLLAQKEIDKKEGLKVKAYEISVVKEKHDELVKHSLLTKSYYEGLVKEKTKTQNDSFVSVHELKQEMHANLKYVESLEKEIDELESDKAEFSNMYDMLLQECVSNDVMCSYLHSLSDLDVHTELQCLYLYKVKECDCLAQKLSKQTKSVSKEVYTELLRSFSKLEKHSISLELALQQCQEQMNNDTLCREKASNVFRKEREQYFEIQDLKAQLQDKNIAIRKYDLWLIRIEKHFLMTGYSLWKVILNGNKVLKRTVGEVERIYEHTFAEEKVDRKNEMKARRTLLMALPNKDQLKFHSYKDEKFLMEAIEKWLQKLISQLEIQGEVIEQEGMNLKPLRSLPSEWKTHALIWRNKVKIETISLDDFYNNLKIYEHELTRSTSTSQNPQNVAFVSSNITSNTHEVDNTAYGVSNAHTQGLQSIEARLAHYNKNEAVFEESINVLNLEDNALVENKKKLEKAKKERDELKLTLEKFQNSSKSLNNLLESQGITPPKSDLMFMDEKVESESINVIFEVTPSNVKTVESKHESVDIKNKVNVKTVRPSLEKITFVKTARKTVKKVETPEQNKHCPRRNQRNWNNLMSQRLGSDFKMINKACFDCVSFKQLHYVCDQKVIRPVWNNTRRVNQKNFPNKMSHPHPKGRFVPQAVLTGSGKLKTTGASANAVRPVLNTANLKSTVNSLRLMPNAFKKGHSQVTRPFNKYSANKNNIFNKKVNTVMVKDTTARERAVVSENMGKEVNVVKALACWVWKAKHSSALNTFKKYSYIDARGRSNFKLFDEIQVLLRVPRKDNIYSVDLKNVIPTGGLTCLFVKATIDNSVAKRKNRTLIEATRTMALVIKSHNKTPYELIRRRPPLIDFMKPFGCHVTILNTRDHLGKFNGKANEGFFVGYFVVSKAMRVFNRRTRIVEKTLNIRFLENAPNVKGNGPEWLFDVDSLIISMNYVPVAAGNQTNGNKDELVTRSEVERILQQERQTEHINNTNSFNTVNTPVSTDGPSFADAALSSTVNTTGTPVSSTNALEDHLFARFSPFKNALALPHVLNVSPINDTRIFGNAYDDEDVEKEVDMNNVVSSYTVPDASSIKFLKDHPKDQVISSLATPVQTRQITKINEEHGLISTVQKLRRTNHKDFQNCMFACYLSQMEPVQALKDPSRVEAMQDELLQFKLLKVWTLVDLPRDKWAIGTKWVFRNKKDERGIVVKNKARLVAQGHTQEECIDYDDAPIARIEAIRLFLAYASFKNFIVYKMDVKSAFLYGKIEKEVYVYQPPGFEDPDFPDKVYKVEKALYGLHQASRACQDKYEADILKKFDYSTVKTISTPIEPKKALIKDEEAKDVPSYTKDFAFYVVKRIFRYLKDQPKLGIWYLRDSPFDLEAFFDSDYVGASLDRKSTTEGCHFLGRSKGWEMLCEEFKVKIGNSLLSIARTIKCKSTKISRSSRPTNLVADRTAHKERGDIMERAATNASSLEDEQDSEVGEGLGLHTDSHFTPIDTQPSSSKPQKKQNSKRKKRKVTEVDSPSSEIHVEESVPTSSNDPLPSGEDSMQLNELMRRMIDSIDQDAEIALVNEAQGRMHDEEIFRVNNLEGDEVIVDVREKIVEKEVSTIDPVTTVGKAVTTANFEVSVDLTTATTADVDDELTMAKTLITIKAAKPKVITTAATTVTTVATIRPKAKGIMIQELSERTSLKPTVSSLKPSQAKDKGNAKMVEQEEQRLARQTKEEANIALINEWDNTHAMMDADCELAEKLQKEDREELSNEEKSKLFVKLMNKRKKHFEMLRAKQRRRRPPTKAQKRKKMFKDKKEGSSKRIAKQLKSNISKKQKLDENVEAEVDDSVELKNCLEIVLEDEDDTMFEPQVEDTIWTYKQGLAKKFKKAEKEIDELKLTLEKFQTSSESLNNLLENQENVKSRSDKGYHAVPLPYTENHIPPKPDLMFIDEQVKSESVDVISNVTSSDVKTVESKHESVDVKNKGVYSTVETKPIRKNKFSPPIIEDWNSDGESKVESEPKVEGNPQQKEYKEKEVIDSGCSRHMIGKNDILLIMKIMMVDLFPLEMVKTELLAKFCDIKGIKREFSVARTPQHSGVAKRKNRTLIEAARTMLVGSKFPTTFSTEAVNTACYVLSRALVIKPHNKTPYELIHGRTLLIDFMKPFGYPVTILNTRDSLGKFDGKADEGFFVGYSMFSKAMRLFNKRTRIVEETLNIRFLENAPNVKGNRPDWLFDINSLTISMNYEPVVTGKQTNGIAGTKDNIIAGPKDNVVDAAKKATEVFKSRVSDNGRQDDQVTRSDFEWLLQQERQTKHINSTNSFNTIVSPVNTVEFSPFKKEFSLPHVPIVTPINDIGIFRNAYDDEAVEEKVGMNNAVSSYTIHGAPLTKFLKNHPKDQVIGASTLMEPDKALIKDAEAKDVDVYLYRSMIGSLMYLTAFRPNITFAVCACARFQVTPKTSHLHAVKRIFRYLKVQPKLGLWKSTTEVDGKKVIVNEAYIRRDLRLDDAKGITCLPNDAIFEGLARMRGEEEDNSCLKRLYKERIAEIDDNKDLFLSDETAQDHRRIKDQDVHDLDGDEDATVTESVEGIAAATTPQISKDELILAQILMEIKAAKPKAKGVTIQKPSEFRTTSPPQPLQPPQAKDNGKGIMVEPEKPLKKRDQIALDEEVARKLEAKMKAEMDEVERIAREKNEANRALSIEERSKLLAELIESRRKYFAAKRAEEIRNKPPTKAHQKSLMCTYMKNIEGFKQNDFKGKSFYDIKKMFKKVYKRENTFLDMNTENVEESLKKTQAKATEGNSKRAGQELEQKSAKKQKLDEHEQAKIADDDTTELKRCLEIVPEDEDDVAIKATPISSKSPTIVDYKIYRERKKSYFKIIRADENSQNYLTFGTMFKNFNIEDLEVLKSIVKERFKKTKPVDDMDNLLFQTLKTMSGHHVEDIIWKYQQGAVKVYNWKLYDSCGLYCVTTKDMVYCLLVEKMYPFTNNILHQLWTNVRLQVDYEVEMAYDLLRLIRRHINEGYKPE
nr:hypothetical protein [Tanacetum cinerariifolium]